MGDVIADLAAEKEAFAARCRADVSFTTKVLAAVLANEETKFAFRTELEKWAPANYAAEGLNVQSGTVLSYKLKPIEQRLAISVSASDGGLPPGSGSGSNQLVLLGYNGEWSGLLPQASKLLKILPLGAVITALTQAIFGTKLGPLLLTALLAL